MISSGSTKLDLLELQLDTRNHASSCTIVLGLSTRGHSALESGCLATRPAHRRELSGRTPSSHDGAQAPGIRDRPVKRPAPSDRGTCRPLTDQTPGAHRSPRSDYLVRPFVLSLLVSVSRAFR